MHSLATLITGASSGIGLHLAGEFAANGHSLVLVAPSQSELETVKQQLASKYDVDIHAIAADLEEPDDIQHLYEEVQRLGIQVGILVNNAGHGFRGKTWELSLEQDISMIRLNIEAAVRLTKLFLPPMIERGQGRILNTASVAGFEPGPLLNVYHATKAFLLSWSEALAVELEDTGITVTALCPGPTDTDFFPKANMLNARAFQKASVMAPQDVAKTGYKALMDGKLFVVPGAANKALVMARRFLTEEAQAEVNLKFYEEVAPEDQERQRGEFENAATSRV